MSEKISCRRAVTAAAYTIPAVIGGGTAVYAADSFGIQRQIQVWLRGNQTTASVRVSASGGSSQYSIEDENRNVVQRSGGTVADSGGYLYYKDHTDNFDDNGLCYIPLQNEGRDLYVTVIKNGALPQITPDIRKKESPEGMV